MTKNENLIKAMEYSENRLKEVERNKLDDEDRKVLDALLDTFSQHIRKLKVQA